MPPPGWIDALPRDRLVREISTWSSDLLGIGAEIDRIDRFADIHHVDAADGHFAPSLLFFPDLVAAMRGRTATPIHVHLMCADAVLAAQAEAFAEAGADVISLHAENEAMPEVLDELERRGIPAGLVLKVETPVARIEPWLPRLAFVTLLGTAIGVKGQGLDPRAADRMAEARRLVAGVDDGRRRILAADGAIREHTVPDLAAAGAQSVVLGSLAFGAPDLAARMAWLDGIAPGAATG